ncbi:MAG TPA: class I SAM-dependent methyltransferase [Sedimentisphaerales bacterium]|nr:class I SAM-dependent methyltransferase [Sedimentisphaerales bacterium]
MKRNKIEQSVSEKIRCIKSGIEEVRFPDKHGHVNQDEEWCEIITKKERRRIRFHDYHKIFQVPGLYEEIFHGRLDCQSPFRVVRLLDDVVAESEIEIRDLKVLEIGAGNGIVGETLRAYGVRSIVGIDILDEAKHAVERDRPDTYDNYFIVDFTDVPERQEEQFRSRKFNCLVTVAALGFGDIPPDAFAKALDLIEINGWLAFNIKEDFVYQADRSGFAQLIDDLNRKQIIQTQAYRRYRHRYSITGAPLYYVAFVSRKLREVPDEILQD